MLHAVNDIDTIARFRFVFGGDAVDKGPGDVQLCKQLVSLKRRHPDRVVLLVGNRDLNKLRFSAELADDDMGRPIDEIPGPYWDPKAKTLRQYLEQVAAETGNPIEAVNTRPERLRWMYKCTLGCPDTFDFRKQELAELSGRNPAEVSDDEVVDFCVAEIVNPDGALRQYIELGQVAARIGNSLFVHGAVDAKSMGFIPPSELKFELPNGPPPPSAFEPKGVDEWIAGLNDFLRAG